VELETGAGDALPPFDGVLVLEVVVNDVECRAEAEPLAVTGADVAKAGVDEGS